jgi:hypothetical protein
MIAASLWHDSICCINMLSNNIMYLQTANETANIIPAILYNMSESVRDDIIIRFVLMRYDLSALTTLCHALGFTVSAMRYNIDRLCTTAGNGRRAMTVHSRWVTEVLSAMKHMEKLDAPIKAGVITGCIMFMNSSRSIL